MNKVLEKELAIKLRQKGLSYGEILKIVPVAKSSLSLWLRSVDLSKKQIQRLTKKKRLAQLRGGAAKHNQMVLLTEKIYRETEKDINKVSKRELWFMGIMLYWAEGSKEKEDHPGSGIRFSNSDPLMIRFFLKWLTEICGINKEEIKFEIYIHENSKNNIERVIDFWSKQTGFNKYWFRHIYYKKNNLRTNRKNIDEEYYGLIRVVVKKSSYLNRKINGWVSGICKNCGIV